MSFLASIKRHEQEKQRISTWPRAVRQLNWFIRQYLRKAGHHSTLAIKPDLLRVDGILLDRLTVWLEGETITVSPVVQTEAAARDGRGCVVIRSTNGISYNLVWNGESPGLPEQWQIGRADGGTQSDQCEFDHFTVAFGPESKLIPLCESSLDEALGLLFGLSDRITEVKAGTSLNLVMRSHDPLDSQRLFGGSEKRPPYTSPANVNGRGNNGESPV
jgi:hypothetical protein